MKYHNTLKKLKLINNTSSLYKLNYRCGNTDIWIKRDDILDFAFGGNKVRLFEYIAPFIQQSKAERLVTYGSRFSNHVRVAAATASLLGIDCDIIILDDEVTDHGGNFELLKYYNPCISHCSIDNAHDFIDEYQMKLKAQDINFIWIPGGGHLPEAAFGYADASYEIQKQAEAYNINIDAVFLPCGTGTTQAGLIYGFAGTATDVIGVSVSRPENRCRAEISDMLSNMNSIYPNEASCHRDIKVLKNNSVYGRADLETDKIIRTIAASDGIFLDPVYNAKAFTEMCSYILEHPYLNKIVYLNTGGTPNIFY